MRIGKERRKYLADALSKTAEYTFSVVILGSIATQQIRPLVLAVAAVGYVILMGAGTLITPEE